MATFNIISFLVLALCCFVVYLKKGNKLADFFTFLYFSLALSYIISGFENRQDGIKLTSFLILFLAINYIVSQFTEKKRWILVNFLSVFGFSLFLNENYNFQDYPLIFDIKNMLILPLLATIFPFLLHWKSKFLIKLFPDLNIQSAINTIGIGVLLSVSLFFGKNFGLVLSAVAFYATELYLNKQKEEKSSIALTLFSLGFLLIIIQNFKIDMISLLQSSTLMGLFFGAGIGILFSKMNHVSKEKFTSKAAILLLALILCFVVIFIEVVKEHLGGIAAFSGLMLAFLLTLKTRNQLYSLSFILFAFSLIFISEPYLKKQEIKINSRSKFTKLAEKIDKKEKNSNEKEEIKVLELKGKDISTINGDWKINSKVSKIDFELGPKDSRTLGVFKTIIGRFIIEEESKNSLLKVQIPLTGFSTFNDFRDDGLMGEDFFDAEKFAVLSFTSTSIEKKGDVFFVSGRFIMKGVKQKITLELKLLESGKDEQGEYALIAGKSSLDRTKFNMQSDPKIGDIVDFSFELELRK